MGVQSRVPSRTMSFKCYKNKNFGISKSPGEWGQTLCSFDMLEESIPGGLKYSGNKANCPEVIDKIKEFCQAMGGNAFWVLPQSGELRVCFYRIDDWKLISLDDRSDSDSYVM